MAPRKKNPNRSLKAVSDAPTTISTHGYSRRLYPCGCRAEGPGNLPDYCLTHGAPKPPAHPLRRLVNFLKGLCK